MWVNGHIKYFMVNYHGNNVAEHGDQTPDPWTDSQALTLHALAAEFTNLDTCKLQINHKVVKCSFRHFRQMQT